MTEVEGLVRSSSLYFPSAKESSVKGTSLPLSVVRQSTLQLNKTVSGLTIFCIILKVLRFLHLRFGGRLDSCLTGAASHQWISAAADC